jgi:EAL domain-containing protein (putative c-di-GMP-specific phosphodiesterase class I)/GGDEF domain-containing protein
MSDRHEKSNVGTVRSILEGGSLACVFQPLVTLADASIFGYEGLVRGPGRNGQQSPDYLFRTARTEGCVDALDVAARRVIAQRFLSLDLPGRLFVNIAPDMLVSEARPSRHARLPFGLEDVPPNRLVIELTESSTATSFEKLVAALDRLRALGCHIAIDDLGEGFASLKLWTEVRPEMVKVDRHFINGIQSDGLKLRFVQAIQHIAQSADAIVVAEGVETEAELRIIRDLGITLVQGFVVARPSAKPSAQLAPGIRQALSSQMISVYPAAASALRRSPSAAKLLRHVTPVADTTSNDAVFQRFEDDPDLESLPVVQAGQPVGLIDRHRFFDKFARPYQRELFGRRPCTMFMDDAPLVVDHAMTIQALSLALARGERRHLSDGFVITAEGRYLGLGTGHDLVHEITQLQMTAARYANPLTSLPGNVPISEHMDRLVASVAPFVAGYADIDHFKPFNDVFGYRKGDEVIQLLGRILVETVDEERDFVGHVGGDDFMLLMQTPDWEPRFRLALDRFGAEILDLMDETTRAHGGFEAEDRRGERRFHPIPTLSIGAVVVPAGAALPAVEISALVADAKRQAKREPGNSLFVERRRFTA